MSSLANYLLMVVIIGYSCFDSDCSIIPRVITCSLFICYLLIARDDYAWYCVWCNCLITLADLIQSSCLIIGLIHANAFWFSSLQL